MGSTQGLTHRWNKSDSCKHHIVSLVCEAEQVNIMNWEETLKEKLMDRGREGKENGKNTYVS